MNITESVEFFHIGMASRTDTALDQLNHVINVTFSSIGILHCNRCIGHLISNCWMG